MKQEPPNINWDRLRGLRDLFLQPDPIPEPYWSSNTLLRDYDITLGERIGWKWDAVLRELDLRGWRPPSSAITDIGCGTGVAARRLLNAYPGHFKKVTLWDRDARAMKYAKQKIRHEHPDLKVVCAQAFPETHALTLVSHVLTELNDERAAGVVEGIEGSRGVIWVEPGTYAMSRLLIEIREALRERYKLLAPCTHQNACGLLAEGNEPHWCHHFAPAPDDAHRDPFWGRFRREMNLDIGPVAYSFLVLGREDPGQEDLSHLVGDPVRFPKFLRVLNCQADGVTDMVCSRKADVYRTLKKAPSPAVYRFDRKKNRITGGEWIGSG